MTLLQEQWRKNGIPENAGMLAGAPNAGSFHDRFAKLRSGQMRDEVKKFTHFNTNKRGQGQGGGQPSLPQGAVAFQAIPEPKVGKDRRPIDPKNKVEVAKFNTPKSTGNSELDAIANLFGGGRKTLDNYGGGQPMGYNQVPQMGYQQNNEINLDQLYAQKGGDYFDPRQMIMQNQQRNPQQQQLDYNAYNQQQQQQMNGYNPNMPMEQQMMQMQYGEQAQVHQPSEYMQYSQQAQYQQSNDPRTQMEEIARTMTLQVLSEYKKQEKKNQLLTKVRHKNHDNLVKDQNGQHYLMEFNNKKHMVLKPVRMTNKS